MKVMEVVFCLSCLWEYSQRERANSPRKMLKLPRRLFQADWGREEEQGGFEIKWKSLAVDLLRGGEQKGQQQPKEK